VLRKVPVFLYAFLIGLLIRSAAVQIGVVMLSLVPPDLGVVRPWLDFALRAPFVALAEAASHAAIGFVFWSGTDESWPAAGGWTAVGGTLVGFPLWRLPGLGQPLLLAVVAGARLAGSFLGPWYGDRTEHDGNMPEIRSLLFGLYPLRLPR
jgi:hypothetical protein